VPGQSGNPGGRPKTAAIGEALRNKLKQAAPGKQRRTIAEQLADTLVAQALDGDVRAICEIRDTCEGRPVQRVERQSQEKPLWETDPEAHRRDVDRAFYEIYGIGKPPTDDDNEPPTQ
jgi:hypothetical protein